MNHRSIEVAWQALPEPGEVEQQAVERALRQFLNDLELRGSGVSVVIADDAFLAQLNAAHRGLNRPTDVLSWSYLDEAEPQPELLGDVAVSLQRVRAQAQENGWDTQTELLRLLAHGCAHLAGYDHETDEEEREMRAVEIRLLHGVGLRGLYPDETPGT